MVDTVLHLIAAVGSHVLLQVIVIAKPNGVVVTKLFLPK